MAASYKHRAATRLSIIKLAKSHNDHFFGELAGVALGFTVAAGGFAVGVSGLFVDKDFT